MSHNLTETATYDANVQVADGTDPGDQRSELITVMAQSLANRTKFLKAITDHVVRADQANTFAAFLQHMQGLLQLDAGLTITAGDVTLPAGGAVVYDTPPTRPVCVDMSLAAVSGAAVYDAAGGYVSMTAGAGDAVASLRMPAFAQLHSVEVLFEQSGASDVKFNLYKRVYNFTSPAHATTQLGSVDQTSGTTGEQVLPLAGGDTPVTNNSATFCLRATVTGSVSVRVFGVRFNFIDPGLTNG